MYLHGWLELILTLHIGDNEESARGGYRIFSPPDLPPLDPPISAVGDMPLLAR